MASRVVPLSELLDEAVAQFRLSFGGEPAFCGVGPGRVNLIGEHTDYNDGFVLPMALPLVTVVVGGLSNATESVVVTTCKGADAPLRAAFPLDGGLPDKDAKPRWANYVRGVVANFPGGSVPGFHCVVASSVPLGSGLSSSAALEVGVHSFLEALTGRQVPGVQKALACQKAEHQYAFVPCGIMDQFVSAMGRAGHALLIDCRSRESRLVAVSGGAVAFVIADTGVRHQLSGGEYAARRQQCTDACTAIGVQSLRDATEEQLEAVAVTPGNKLALRRARHVIGEIQRTREAAEMLTDGKTKVLGQLMTASHESLRDLFEVSCPELDELVRLALATPGVLGSRMTGGGFGGCTVTLVEAGAVDALVANLSSKYSGTATMHIATPSEGAQSFKLPKAHACKAKHACMQSHD